MAPTIITSLWMLVGSYALPTDDGIRLYRFDEETCEVQLITSLTGISNPSFLTISDDKHFIYAVGEDEGLTSTANSISLDLDHPSMKIISTQLTNGGAPCNITLSPDNRHLLTANYFGGNISLFNISTQGILSPADTIQFNGHSIDPVRQTKSYLHSVAFSPDNRYLLANDLGSDKIYKFSLVPNDSLGSFLDLKTREDVSVKPGMGPRHLCFSPDGNMIYVIGELSGEVCALSYNNGNIQMKQTIMADEYNGAGSADIHISPDGKFLYASHRLKGDGISVMKVLPDGSLQKVAYQLTGIHPRNFAITPNGKFLLVACRDSNHIEIFSRDISSGILTPTGKTIEIPQPVCIKFVK